MSAYTLCRYIYVGMKVDGLYALNRFGGGQRPNEEGFNPTDGAKPNEGELLNYKSISCFSFFFCSLSF